MSGVSPTPKVEEADIMEMQAAMLPKAYQITLGFNEAAQLVSVDAPEWMARTLLIEHLAIATQFIAQVAAKEVAGVSV